MPRRSALGKDCIFLFTMNFFDTKKVSIFLFLQSIFLVFSYFAVCPYVAHGKAPVFAVCYGLAHGKACYQASLERHFAVCHGHSTRQTLCLSCVAHGKVAK